MVNLSTKLLVLVLLLSVALLGCSGGKSGEIAMDEANLATEHIVPSKDAAKEESANNEKREQTAYQVHDQERLVIYNAELRLEIKDFKKVEKEVEQMIRNQGGYIVQENIYQSEENKMEGTITARIPQDQFHSLLTNLEKLAIKVHARNVTGQDVTEEYVDLEARLKSKQAVEERLYQFIKEAKETKDLLAISNDLARVQEEIEQIKGRMNYLQTQSSFSTVTIYLFENKVVIPNLEKEQLNTWEKTKKQFMSSVNFLLMLLSNFVIITVGSLPIIVITAMILAVGVYIWKWKKGKLQKENNEN